MVWLDMNTTSTTSASVAKDYFLIDYKHRLQVWRSLTGLAVTPTTHTLKKVRPNMPRRSDIPTDSSMQREATGL